MKKRENGIFSVIDVIEIEKLTLPMLNDCCESSNLFHHLKAEPFKQWLAKVGYERMQEIADPERSIERARENWQKLGLSEECLPAAA